VNDSLVFRIPHRKVGAGLMDNECAVLGYLNRQGLSLPIPNPLYVAAGDDRFPYTIAGYEMIVGQTADAADLAPAERSASAARLGAFLAGLHRVPTDVPCALGDELKRADFASRLPKVLENLGEVPLGFRELLIDLASTPPPERPVWVHGDLYTRHLVVDETRHVSGVIDWGDVHVGDPALDISIAWMFLPPEVWPTFIEAYGGVEQNTWRRARFRAMCHWLYLRQYAEERQDANLQRELEFVLANVLIESA